MAQKLECQMLMHPRKCKEKQALLNHHEYESVLEELDCVKKELSRLKLDLAFALEAKAKAKKDTEASVDREKSCLRNAEELRKQIDKLNEEHVLVELARMEAERESKEIEAHRKAKVDQFCNNIRETRRQIVELHEEIVRAKDLENKLDITTSDVNALKSEIESARVMERNFQKNNPTECVNSLREESECSSMLHSAETELMVSKKELGCIKEEGYKFMTAIDILRRKLMNVANEMDHLRKRERISEFTSHYLNSRLLRAKSDLDSALLSYERAKLIVLNMVAALQQLRVETVTAKIQEVLLNEERKYIEIEIEKADSDIYIAEVRLEVAMQELKTVKASEANALEMLKNVTQRTAGMRASHSFQDSTITITQFEYDYLNTRAGAAKEVAATKIAAAQAWIASLEAEEMEVLIEIQMIQRKLKVLHREIIGCD